MATIEIKDNALIITYNYYDIEFNITRLLVYKFEKRNNWLIVNAPNKNGNSTVLINMSLVNSIDFTSSEIRLWTSKDNFHGVEFIPIKPIAKDWDKIKLILIDHLLPKPMRSLDLL